MTCILGIETSCDETAAAVVENGRYLRSNIVSSQIDLHKKYGGVFPEMASRQHILSIVPVVQQALAESGVTWKDLAAIAAINGPGLAGALLVGANVAKALAWAQNLPLVGVNHLEAHVYANWLAFEHERRVGDGDPSGDQQKAPPAPAFPLVCLVVSGGHTDLILMREHHDYQLLGRTIDDAAGEAFDKVARLLGLGYPGGPVIQRMAEKGNPEAYALPRALQAGPFDFSFSGLKTAVLHLVQQLQRERGITPAPKGTKLAEVSLSPQDDTTQGEDALPVADIAASFQAAVVDALVTKTAEAARRYGVAQVLLAGGVAANQALRRRMAEQVAVPVRCPPIAFCTDNAAMTAAAGYYRFLAGQRSGLDLDVVPNLRLV
jgi:N6-L-threonylcarbamoyladenine synthase